MVNESLTYSTAALLARSIYFSQRRGGSSLSQRRDDAAKNNKTRFLDL
jgi:hypothetical protein